MSNTTICLHKDCLTVNSLDSKFCEKCGQQLLLRNRYQAIKKIGQGGFGRTFLAKDLDKPSKSYCVIKQFFPENQEKQNIDKASKLFAQEGKRLEQLGKHPQIPELFAYFVENDQQEYLVQEYIAGQNLQDELKNQGVYNEIQIIELLVDILKILNFVHKNQVIHRDIKPENIIRRSSDAKLVLVDFGAAKHFTSPTTLNVTGTVIGSAQYCSPEQARGKPVFASDLYSLGVTCIHLLTNVDPFQLFDISENDWVWQSYLVNNPVSQELADVLNKLIVVGLKQRFQSVQEVWQVLAKYHLIAKLPSNNTLTTTNVTPVANTPKVSQSPEVSGMVAKTLTTVQQKILTTVQSPPIEVFELGEWGKLEMIYIPAGSFAMGNEHRQEEKPLHTVNIKPFYMSKYQITQIQYKLLFGDYHHSRFKGRLFPADNISYDMAKEFCLRLSQKTGRKFRLPSESEWEYACRANTKTKFYLGNLITKKEANFKSDGTVEMGTFSPNPWGLYDMHGNVWEWCADSWHDNYVGAPTDGSVWNENAKKPDDKILRGGSFRDDLNYCSSHHRNCSHRGKQTDNIGFRVCMEP